MDLINKAAVKKQMYIELIGSNYLLEKLDKLPEIVCLLAKALVIKVSLSSHAIEIGYHGVFCQFQMSRLIHVNGINIHDNH